MYRLSAPELLRAPRHRETVRDSSASVQALLESLLQPTVTMSRSWRYSGAHASLDSFMF
jgi:hypothetical protein